MRKSLTLVAAPFFVLSLAAVVAPSAAAAPQASTQQEFRADAYTKFESLADARTAMRTFETTNSQKCTETSHRSVKVEMLGMWSSTVTATCTAASA